MKSLSIVCFCAGIMAFGTAMAQENPQSTDIFGIGLGNRSRWAVFYGKRVNSFGVQVGVYNNIDLDRNRLSSGFPPNDTLYFGGFRTNPGVGSDLLYFPGSKEQSVYGGLGMYYEGITQVGRSPSSGLLYDIGTKYVLKAGYSLGLHASVSHYSDFGLGYHNLLGWNISFTMRK
ncbi:MAG: hypothetical protein WCI55_16175 [Armatimonadota bacterium]